MSQRDVTSVSTNVEYKPDKRRNVTSASTNVEYKPDKRRNVTSASLMVEYRKKPSNTGPAFCPICWIGAILGGNPINLQSGDKFEEATDLSLTTPAGSLAFTRTYRQSKQADYQFMGLGWIHNHQAYLVKTTGTPNRITVQLPNGGEAYFTETSTDHYEGATGVGSVVDWNGMTYTLTAMDKSTYSFDSVGQLISRTWPSHETWVYSYYASGPNVGKLEKVEDQNYDLNGSLLYRKLIFRYYTSGPFNGQLYRVGDQTFDDTNPAAPTGRYVEFSYSLNKINSGGSIVDGAGALLAGVKDTRGNVWIYDYYGQNTGETDLNLLNFLTKRLSPVVDSTGDGADDGLIIQERVAYTLQSGALSALAQDRGLGGTELAVNGTMELDSNWTNISGAAPATNERSPVRVDSGSYSRHVVANANGQGIEGNVWDLAVGSSYLVLARIYPVSGVVKMHVSGETAFDRVTDGTGAWTTLVAFYTPGAAGSGRKLQFFATGGPAEFYVDSVAITRFDTPATLSTNYTFQPGDSGVTQEITAGKTTSHRFDNTLYVGAIDPAGNTTLQDHNLQFRPGMQADPNGNRTYLGWSADGKQLKKVTDALSNPTAFDYIIGGASDGALNYSLDAQGRKTQYVYGDLTNPRLPTEVKVLDTNGTTVLRWQKFTYDSRGRTLTEQTLDPANGITVLQRVTRNYYTSGLGNGFLQSVIQEDLVNPANNRTTTYFYDSAGRVVKTTQNTTFGSCTSSFTLYDAAGNVLASICNYEPGTNPDPTTVAQAIALYNPALPDKNRVTTYEYDTLGRRVKMTTDAGASYAQTTLTAYDSLDRVVRTIGNYISNAGVPNPYTALRSAFSHGSNNDQNLVADTVYNERGLVRSQTDVLGNVTLFGYDDAGRLVKTIQSASQPNYNNSYGIGGDPSLASYVASSAPDQDIVTANRYDPAGNLVKAVDPVGNVSFTVYDALNRPVKTIRNAKDSATIDLNVGDPGYNAANDPRSASYVASTDADRDFIEVTEYDSLGRVKRAQDLMGAWTLYGCDALGRQVKVIRSASNPSYYQAADPSLSGYSPNSNPDQDLITQTTYDSQGRVLYTTDVQGQRTWFAYDGLNRVVKTIVNAVGTATDGGPNDPRSDSYVLSPDSDKDQITRTTYNTDGRVQWVQDSLGNKTWYVYDAVGRQKKVITNCTYVSGTPAPEDDAYVGSAESDKDLITRTTYDAQGRVFSTTDAGGNQTRFEYDALGRRTKTITNYVDGIYNPDAPDEDLIQTSAYDLGGRVVSTVDARGTQTSVVYDAAGRRLKIIQAAGTPLATTSYTCYDKAGRVLRVIGNWIYDPAQPSPDARDAQGNWLFAPTTHGHYEDENLVTTYTLDRAGRQTAVSDPPGNITATTYFKDGQVESLIDPENAVSQHRYDRVRRRTLVVQGYASVGEDPALWVWSGAPNNRWQKSNGDPIHLPATPFDQNVIAQASYDKPGRVISLRDPRGNLTGYAYDLLGRRTSLTDPLSHVWATAYANLSGAQAGQVRVTATDPLIFQTRQDFDRAGRLSTLQYLGETTPKPTPDVTFTYDKLGNRTLMSESDGAATLRRTQYGYDKARRLVSAGFDTNGDGTVDQTVSYQYDAGGLRTRLTLPGNLTISYSYNARGQLVGLTDWSSQATRFAYDSVGRRIAVERFNGLRSAYRYDAGSRLRALRHAAGSKTLGHFEYAVDKRGNRTEAFEVLPQAGSGTTVIDTTNQAVIYQGGVWTQEGEFRTSLYLGANFKLAFFGDQATLTMGTGSGYSIFDVVINGALWQSFDGYAATPGERVIAIALDGEGPWVLEVRNRAERNLNSTGYKIAFKNLSSNRLYDAQTVRYTYDALARLSTASIGRGLSLSAMRQYFHGYDRAGNRTYQGLEVNGVLQSSVSYTYDAANRLTGDGTYTYEYFDNGNLRYKKQGITVIDTYAWDRANRLLSMGTSAYQYNGLGHRVQQTVGAQVTQYLLDVQPGLWQVLQATTGVDITRYVQGPLGVLEQINLDGTRRSMVPDGLGSLRVVADSNLNVLESRQYSPYGEGYGGTGSSQTVFGFTGEETDGNSLVNLRARYYNPTLGIFPSLDPVEGDIGQPMALNRYAYASGNPVNLTDPSGLCHVADHTGRKSTFGELFFCEKQIEALKHLYGITLTTDASLSAEKEWIVERVRNVSTAVNRVAAVLASLTRRAIGDTELRLIPGNPFGADGAAVTVLGQRIDMRVQYGTYPAQCGRAGYQGNYIPCTENIIHEFGHIITLDSNGRLPKSEERLYPDREGNTTLEMSIEYMRDAHNRPVALWEDIRKLTSIGQQGWNSSLRQNRIHEIDAEYVADMFMFYILSRNGDSRYDFTGNAGRIRKEFMEGSADIKGLTGQSLNRTVFFSNPAPAESNNPISSAGLIGWINLPRFKGGGVPQPTSSALSMAYINQGSC
jgi:RHS repeat-associated protein